MASSYVMYADRYSDGALQFQPRPQETKSKTRNSIASSSFRDGQYRSKIEVVDEGREKEEEAASTTLEPKDACGDCCCCRALYSERFRQFTEETTLHGLRHAVARTMNPVRRLLWTVLLTALVFTTFTYWYMCWSKFLLFPVNTVVSLNYRSEIDFPAITICNYNRYRKSFIKGTRFEEWVRRQYPTFNLSDDETPVEFDDELLKFTSNRTSFEISAAHDKWQMIYQCTFGRNRIPCNAGNFTRTLTDFGVCYTFNGATYDEGHDVIHVSHGGSEHGLRLRLFVDQLEYTFGENSGAGFKVLAHSQEDTPLVRNFGFAIPPGVEALVGLRMIQEHNLPPPYISKCSNQILKYYDRYTHSNCVRERTTDIVVEVCSCREIYMPGEARVCNFSESVECVLPTIQMLNVTCPVACHTTNYESRVSYAMFPGRHIVNELAERFNITDQAIKENVVDLRIYFEEISFEEIRQVKGYSFPDLIGDTGGQMGLCLGASLMSIYEILEFVAMAVWRKISH
ncbi:acid-sensing ion channel 1-like [Glandiceps talaboti]